MIETPLIQFESDLKEVLTAMQIEEGVKIKHLFKESENKLINTFIINGQSYAYGNLVKPFADEIERKRLVKRYAKLSLYKALERAFGKSLPWGALTGIRPTKLAYSQIEETGEFEEFFTDTMKVSKEKTALVKRIIETQKGIYDKNIDGTDFFVFVPFCPSKCRYCSFVSADVRHMQKYVNDYVKTLIREIRESRSLIKNLRSIYVGGGTPVCLDNENLESILKQLALINNGVEFTVEAGRPDVITEDNLKLLKDYGVTRICVNPQTFNDKTLKLIGRNHTAKDIFEKYELAKKYFDVNMDLIAGLEGETFEDFKNSLENCIKLDAENITVHTLCVKKGSALAETTTYVKADEIEKMVDFAHCELSANGYNPYYLYRQKYMAGNLENTGYAKPNKACVYNVDVMEEITDNVACGANAISKAIFNGAERIERYANPKDVLTYLNKIDTIIEKKKSLFQKK